MSKELRRRILELNSLGYRVDEIAKELDITQRQVVAVLRPGE